MLQFKVNKRSLTASSTSEQKIATNTNTQKRRIRARGSVNTQLNTYNIKGTKCMLILPVTKNFTGGDPHKAAQESSNYSVTVLVITPALTSQVQQWP